MKRRRFLTGVLAAGGTAPFGVWKTGTAATLMPQPEEAKKETETSPTAGGKNQIRYINPNAPKVNPPQYPGTYYEALVPATLDLAERASLAVNGLTESLDPDYDHELYWIVDLLADKPVMYHTVDDHVQFKFHEALPLCRTASGSKQNLDVEHQLMQTFLKMQGPNGLIYLPIKGRPWALPPKAEWGAGIDTLPKGDQWCSLTMNGRILAAMSIYALKDPNGPWRQATERLVQGLKSICILEDDIAYQFENSTEAGRPVVKPAAKPIGQRAAYASWVAQGLAHCQRALGNKEAGELALRLMRYIMRGETSFGPKGEFGGITRGVNLIGFHTFSNAMMAALDVAQVTGDTELVQPALKAYNYGVSEGEPLLGYFPEIIWTKGGAYGEAISTAETCAVADMLVSAIMLCLLGIDKWDDVDRWVRNQFAEAQLTSLNWLTDGSRVPVDRVREPLPGAGSDVPKLEYGTTDRVAERNLGTFAGWPGPNDFVQGHGWSIMHCCTGNGTRAIYYVWQNILTYKDGKLRVNLLLNRASKWADINSHIPYQGRVDIRPKQDLDLEIRLAEWVKPEEARCSVNGASRSLTVEGRYARVGRVKAGEEVVFEFPISERTNTLFFEKHKYQIVRRGNDVVAFDPPGKNCPFYQRGYYRGGVTLWKKVTRFVPEKEIVW